eukprot:736164-Rhodomonas_salina.2
MLLSEIEAEHFQAVAAQVQLLEAGALVEGPCVHKGQKVVLKVQDLHARRRVELGQQVPAHVQNPHRLQLLQDRAVRQTHPGKVNHVQAHAALCLQQLVQLEQRHVALVPAANTVIVFFPVWAERERERPRVCSAPAGGLLVKGM